MTQRHRENTLTDFIFFPLLLHPTE